MQEKLNITLDEEIVKDLKAVRDKIGIPVSVQIQKKLQGDSKN